MATQPAGGLALRRVATVGAGLLVVGATWTAIVASVLNAVLLLGVRIPCEMRALRWATEATPAEPEAA